MVTQTQADPAASFRRILGLDYGSKTVGVAVSDPLRVSAHPLETIFRKKENHLRRTFARINQLIDEYDIDMIVVGNPVYLDGGVGERARLTKEFADSLAERTQLEVVLWDERQSTNYAKRELETQQVRAQDRKQYVDQIAAAFILQGYMDYLRFKEEEDNDA